MAYIHRTGGKRFRHDPANAGIFIHGGSNVFPFVKPDDLYPGWERRESEKRGANSFHITTPLRNRKGEDIPIEVPASFSDQWMEPFPTFNLALAFAKTLRVKYPILADCNIYACTDCVMENRSAGTFPVQLVSPGIKVRKPRDTGLFSGVIPADAADLSTYQQAALDTILTEKPLHA